jgi:hypothetical protein
MFQTQELEKIKTNIICSANFSENRAAYEIKWKKNVQSEKPQIKI